MPDRLEVEFRTIRLFKNFFQCIDAPPTIPHKPTKNNPNLKIKLGLSRMFG